ncbi:MAG: galactose mutarotase [Lachnospiraceae bacterium]|jgi:aldose 1-epimerase|nr:galactose mutarotase [Lachnospiraceae bacterium]
MLHRMEFGVTKDGEKASRFLLENGNGVSVEVSDFGALVLSILVPDRQGKKRDVVLGYGTLMDYYNNEAAFGAYIGRNANRIAGTKVTIEGSEYLLDANDNENNLHSGFNRSHDKFYQSKTGQNAEGDFVEFRRNSPHMEQGFPGALEQKIRYTLTDKNEFVIDYEIVSDRTTVVNPTNHSYFNLDGHESGTVLRHDMKIYSDEMLEINEDMIPTGRILGVADTPFDFRQKKQIGKDIDAEHLLLRIARGYDHSYVFANDRKLKKVAKLYGANSGIMMEVFSDLCGLQVYTGNFLNGQKGKDGAVYEQRSGVCFETQFYPNSCKEPKFPSSVLPAHEVFKSKTVYQFHTQ